MTAAALAEIGAQHRAVAERLANLAQLAYADGQRAALAECLVGAISDISMHFGYEEALMDDGCYVDFEHHRRQHMGIITELGLMLDHVDVAAQAEVAREVDFLIRWYGEHAANGDRNLEAWLRSRG